MASRAQTLRWENLILQASPLLTSDQIGSGSNRLVSIRLFANMSFLDNPFQITDQKGEGRGRTFVPGTTRGRWTWVSFALWFRTLLVWALMLEFTKTSQISMYLLPRNGARLPWRASIFRAAMETKLTSQIGPDFPPTPRHSYDWCCGSRLVIIDQPAMAQNINRNTY